MFHLTAFKLALLMLFGTIASSAFGSASDITSLAKSSQNPVADMISLPLQNNANFGYGLRKCWQNILNIQPVIHINLKQDFNLITKSIFPIIPT